MNLTELIKGCDILQEVFQKIKENEKILLIENSTIKRGSHFTIVEARKNFALVKSQTEEGCREEILPYGGSVTYNIKDPDYYLSI